MAKLIPCKACGHMIAKSAKACPSCGKENHTTAQGIMGLLVLGFIGYVLFSVFSGDDQPTTAEAAADPEAAAAEAEAAAAAEVACREDLQCYGSLAIREGSFECSKLVERMARNKFEWTDSWLESKFSHFSWADKDAGVVTIIGDKVQFQNGFGAFVNMVYACDWDQPNGAALDLRIEEGRL